MCVCMWLFFFFWVPCHLEKWEGLFQFYSFVEWRVQKNLHVWLSFCCLPFRKVRGMVPILFFCWAKIAREKACHLMLIFEHKVILKIIGNSTWKANASFKYKVILWIILLWTWIARAHTRGYANTIYWFRS